MLWRLCKNPGKKTTKTAVDTNNSKPITNISSRGNENSNIGEQANSQATATHDAETKTEDPDLIKEVKPVSITNDEIAKDDSQEKKQGLFKKIFGKKKKNDN